uniref:Uncharacterized protein n=1 Tax=Arundo donax TaxID=35708 RepID=A0A0A9C033_ARUDO
MGCDSSDVTVGLISLNFAI